LSSEADRVYWLVDKMQSKLFDELAFDGSPKAILTALSCFPKRRVRKLKALYPIVGLEFKLGKDFVAKLQSGTPLSLKREPTNRFDKNAVAVLFEDKPIGYIPKKDNPMIAMAMDQNPEHSDALGSGKLARLVFSSNSRYPHVEVDE
jgi:hypothetical protein